MQSQSTYAKIENERRIQNATYVRVPRTFSLSFFLYPIYYLVSFRPSAEYQISLSRVILRETIS